MNSRTAIYQSEVKKVIASLVLAVAAAAALEVAVPVAAAVPAPAVPVVAHPLQIGASELVPRCVTLISTGSHKQQTY